MPVYSALGPEMSKDTVIVIMSTTNWTLDVPSGSLRHAEDNVQVKVIHWTYERETNIKGGKRKEK